MGADQGQGAERPLLRTVNAAEAQTVITGSSVVSSAMPVAQDMNLLKQMWCTFTFEN